MKKIICVFGTRPEAIKMAPVIKELRKKKEYFDTKIVLTGQHKEMLNQMLELLNFEESIPNNSLGITLFSNEIHQIGIMKKSQSLHHIISETISKLKPIFDSEKPDLVLVQGDTTSALGATIASFYSKIPVGHIEAGLRSDDDYNPYPEEINRVLIDRLSSIHFVPTLGADVNLDIEYIDKKYRFITGNTVIDAFQDTLERAYLYKNPCLRKINFRTKIIMLTIHRRESWGKPLRGICEAIRHIATKYPEIEIIYPVHPNPIVKQIAFEIFHNVVTSHHNIPQIHLIEPLDYSDSVKLINNSYAILTDSGGIVEEASYVGTPVLILREVTERPEALMANSAKLIGTSKKKIIREVNKFLNDKTGYEEMAVPRKIFGDGKASERIVQGIKYYFGITKEKPKEFRGI